MIARKRYQSILFVVAIALGLLLALIDWRFVSRAMTYPEAPIMAVEWYRPRAMVAGQHVEPLPRRQQPLPPAFAAALAEAADYAAARNSTGLLVLHQGEVVLERYWQGYSATSPFNSMSMAKSITGLLIGMAIADGQIESLDTPAAQYLTEWQSDARADITLNDLIYMQSGLRNENSTTRPTSDLVHLFIGSDVAKTALRVPAERPPGEVYEYNNVNTQLLAIVLERATGLSYAEYLSSKLWQPIGALDASIWLDRPNGTAKTFCCLFATIHDWARVGQLLLQNGRFNDAQVVPAEWIASMQVPSPLESSYGKHIWVKARSPAHPNIDQTASTAYLAEDTFHLDGRGLQRVFVVPAADLVIVRMGEQPETWDDAVIPNRLVQALRSPN